MTSYTSADTSKSISINAFRHLAFSLFCALFGAVYEKFSFGVYSCCMIYAFVIPLILGSIPLLSIAIWGKKYPDKTALTTWNSGIAVLTVGCIVQGVLEIYGTTNHLMIVYPIAGFILLSAGIILFFCNLFRKSNKTHTL